MGCPFQIFYFLLLSFIIIFAHTKMTPGGSSLDNIFALLPCCQRKICRFYQSTVLLRFHWRVLITSPSGHFVLDGRESRLFVFQISPLRHLRLSTCFQTSVWPFFLELSFPFCYNFYNLYLSPKIKLFHSTI